jgi:hypothetical protein
MELGQPTQTTSPLPFDSERTEPLDKGESDQTAGPEGRPEEDREQVH